MIRALVLCLPLIWGLSACGTDGQQQGIFGPVSASLSGLLNRNTPRTTPAAIRTALTPQVRAGFDNRPLKIAVLEDQNLASLLIENTRNLDVTTFLTPDGVGISLRQGVLVATRGLGFDLMSADVSDVIPAMRRNGRGIVRVHRYIDGEERIFIRSFICDYAGSATITESCVSDGLRIQNTYRFAGGRIATSRQWISPQRGYLRLESAE